MVKRWPGDNSALRRRALAALILAESGRDGAGHGTRLPTERQLALDLGVSRAAIRHAMALLQAEGRVSREVGRGTFLRGREPGEPGPEPTAGETSETAADEVLAADPDPMTAGPDPAAGQLPAPDGLSGSLTTRRPT